MAKEESSAFQEGQWDGIDRRDHEDVKQYEKALRKRKRRIRDRRIKLVHYMVIGTLFITLFGSLIVAIIKERGLL